MPERDFSSAVSAVSLESVESAESRVSSASACSDGGNADGPGRLGEGMEKSITARAGSQNKVRPEARERPERRRLTANGTAKATTWNGNRQTPWLLKADVQQPRKRIGKRSEPFHRIRRIIAKPPRHDSPS